MDELISKARAIVPRSERANTPFSVRATAGLRLMPEGREAADAIMTAVRDRIASAGFHARSESFVSVMDGSDEGAHGWVSVNYLLGNLGGRPEKTVSVVDLGGGSTQIASRWALAPRRRLRTDTCEPSRRRRPSTRRTCTRSRVRPRGGARENLQRGQERRRVAPVSAHRFRGFVRKGLLRPRAGETYAALGSGDGSDFVKCLAATTKALDVGSTSKSCAASRARSPARGRRRASVALVMSYIVERAVQSGAVPAPKDATKILKVSPADFKRTASRACATPAAELEDAFPLAARRRRRSLSLSRLDVHYALLTTGYGATDDETLRMLDKIMYKRQAVEASWALGDGIAVLGAVRESRESSYRA